MTRTAPFSPDYIATTADLLNTAQAAAALGVEPVTVRSYMARGIITATKFGRDWLIARSEIERVRANPPQRTGRPKRAA